MCTRDGEKVKNVIYLISSFVAINKSMNYKFPATVYWDRLAVPLSRIPFEWNIQRILSIAETCLSDVALAEPYLSGRQSLGI